MVGHFCNFLRSRIVLLPDFSASSRGALYRKILTTVESYISKHAAALPPDASMTIRKNLDIAIRQIEDEFAQAREKGNRLPEWAIRRSPEG